jgi:mono/diheme cytochrome c family protein
MTRIRMSRWLPASLVLILGATLALAQDGKDLFGSKCATCHGKDGAGKTAMGKSLKVKDIHEIAGKVSAAEMIKVTKEGKSPSMAPFGDQLSEADIKAVVEYFRSLAN